MSEKESFEEDYADDNTPLFFTDNALGHGCRIQYSSRKMIKIVIKDIRMNKNEAEGQWSEL